MGIPQTRGAAAETLAAAYLELAGWIIEARNVRIAGVEVDVIACHERVRAVFEVKFRARTDYGGAALAVDRVKRERLRRAALRLGAGGTLPIRIDVVAIELEDDGVRVRHIPNAVQEGT
jgi:putative endonuclease